MSIYVILNEYLEAHDLSAYKLAQKLRGKVARGSVYALARGDAKRIDLRTFGAVLEALEALTGHPVRFDDLLERGSCETAAILTEHPDIKERIARLERGESKLIPWEEALQRLEQADLQVKG